MRRALIFAICFLLVTAANSQPRPLKPISKADLFSLIEKGDEREITGLTDSRLVEMLQKDYAVDFGLNPWKANFDGAIYCHEFGYETPSSVNVAEAIKQTLVERICASDENLCRSQRRVQTDFRAELFKKCSYAEPFLTGVEKLLREVDLASSKYLQSLSNREDERNQRKKSESQAAEARAAATKSAEEDRKRHFATRLAEIRIGKRAIETVADAAALNNAMLCNEVILQPLVTPDNRYCKITGVIDRLDSGVMIGQIGRVNYFYMDTASAKMVGQLRMYGPLTGVGRYIGNTKYRTVIGEEKTMPVFQMQIVQYGWSFE